MTLSAPRRRTSICAALAISLGLFASSPLSADEIPIAVLERTDPVDFQRELLPILRKNCLACHNDTDAESDLVLETPETILKGGLEGPAVVPGKPEESLLLALAAKQGEPMMPPEDNDAGASDLTPQELAMFAMWIRQGAKGDVAIADETIHWKQLPRGVNPIYAAAQSPDGRFVVAGRANRVWVYDVLQGRYVDHLVDASLTDSPVALNTPLAHLDLIQSLAFSHDGSWIASGGYRTVKLWQRVEAVGDPVQLPRSRIAIVARAERGTLRNTLYVADETGTIHVLTKDQPEPLAVLAGHSGRLTSLAVSPEQVFAASSGTDKTVRLWNSDHVESDSQAQAAGVNQLAWIDGNSLAGACDDHVLRIWSVDENGRLATPREMAGHSQPVTAILSLGADQIISASQDGNIRLRSLKTGQTQREFNHGAAVRELVATVLPKRLISAGGNVPAKLWDLESGKLVAELSVDPQLRWQQDQQSLRQRIAQRHVDNLMQDLKSAKQRATEEEANLKKATESGDKAQQEFDKAQQQNAKAVADRAAAEQPTADARAQLAAAEKAARDADDDAAKQAATSQLDEAKKKVTEVEKTLKTKTEAAAKAATELATRRQSLDSAQRSVQTSEKTSADANDAVRRLGPRLHRANQQYQKETDQTKQIDDELQRHQSSVVRVVVSPDGSLIATSDELARIGLWRTVDGKPLDVVALPEGIIVAIAFGPDRDVLVVTADAKLYRIPIDGQWQLAYTIGAPDHSSSLADRVTALSFRPDDQWLAVGGGQPSRSGELKIYQVSDGTLVREITDAHSDTILGLAFSPDGKQLASCGADRFMRVFDAVSGQRVRAFEGHTHHVLSVSWRADGRVLATGGADKIVKLWNVTDGSQIRTIKGFGKEVTSVQFAGASDHFFAACGDQNLYRCDMSGQRQSIGKGQDFLYVVSTSLLGKSIVFGGHDSVVRVVDDQGGRLAELKPDP